MPVQLNHTIVAARDKRQSAIFLAEFATVPWAHVDIAGTAYLSAEKPYGPKGATGAAVGALVQLALDFPHLELPESD